MISVHKEGKVAKVSFIWHIFTFDPERLHSYYHQSIKFKDVILKPREISFLAEYLYF